MLSSFSMSVSKYISFCRSNFLTSFFSYAYGKLTSNPERKAVLNKTLISYAGFSSPCYYYDSFLSHNGNTGSFHSIELFMPEIKHFRSKNF